jgi:hypothetical protein
MDTFLSLSGSFQLANTASSSDVKMVIHTDSLCVANAR